MARKSRLLATRNPPASLMQATMDTLTQGVSQQPAHLRQPGQGERQVNGWSSPVDGLGKRRPTKFVGKIMSYPVEDFYLETMPVTSGERYSVFVRPDNYLPSIDVNVRLQVFLNNKPCDIDVHGAGLTAINGQPPGGTIVEGTAASYIHNETGFYNKYVLINNGPFGLLLNREKITAMAAATTPTQEKAALLFIQGVAYEVTYTVTLNGTDLPVYTTPKATDSNNLLSTDTVATELVNRIKAVAGFTATRVGSVVEVKRTDGADFTLNLSDGRSNTLARSFKGSTASFTGLPTVAPNGFLLKVEQDPSTNLDDYWVKFRTRDTAAFGAGSWVEAPAPGLQYQLDANTMPLVVYRAAPGVLFLGPADGATRTLTVGGKSYSYTFPSWGQRTAGDETSVPNPGFLGKAIKDHTLFRSRYVVIAGESVVFSEVDQVFNFFGDTSAQTLDTDPIDVRATSEASVDLTWMLPIDESLLVFSEKSQFQVRPADADVLTPRSAVCLRLSNIDMNPLICPKIAGPNVLFATNEHGYTGFREYQFFDTQQRRLGLNLGGSLNITINVPKYIKGLATLWDVGESLDYLVCRTPDDRRKLYVYKYLWQSGQGSLYKQQGAWSEWTFDGDIRWVRFFDNELWLVMTYPDGTYTVHITSEELNDPDQPTIYLDRQLQYPVVSLMTTAMSMAAYDPETRLTTFTLPYQIESPTDVVVQYGNHRDQGLLLGSASSGNKIACSVRGDWTADKVVIGARYQFLYEFTTAYKATKDQARERIIGDLNGRLQLATWTIHHVNTSRYDVVVKRKNRAKDSRHGFWARFLNVDANRLNTPLNLLQSGTFRVPVYARNTECIVTVESDSWMPLTLTSASWEGNYSDRSRSMG